MTLALAIIFFALLMIYCGIKGRSLRHALIGASVQTPSDKLLEGNQ